MELTRRLGVTVRGVRVALALRAIAVLVACGGDAGDDAGRDAAAATGSVGAVAVGERGGIIELVDGAWHARDRLVDGELNAVTLLAGGVAYAAGSGHVLRRDVDGTWASITAPPGTVTALASSGDAHVVAGTSDGGIYALEGDAWVSMDSPLEGVGWINDVALAGSSSGLAVGGTNAATPGGVVLVRDGAAWRVLREGRERPFNKVATPAPSLGFLGGYSDFIAGEPLNLTTWSDDQWTPVSVDLWRRFVTAIDAPRPDHALAFTDGGGTPQSGGGGVILAWNGATWRVLGAAADLIGAPKAFFGGCTSSESFAVAVGPGPVVATYDGAAWRAADTTAFAERIPTLHAVACGR